MRPCIRFVLCTMKWACIDRYNNSRNAAVFFPLMIQRAKAYTSLQHVLKKHNSNVNIVTIPILRVEAFMSLQQYHLQTITTISLARDSS